MESIISLLFIIAFVVLVFFRRRNNSPKNKGQIGEERIIQILSQLPNEYTVLNDVVLKTANGTTQIDHVVISKYGIFAIETKNYQGTIYGDDNRQEWTQIIANDVTYQRKWSKTYTYITKNKFYNPVKQAYAHVYAIKNIIEQWPHFPVIPIVVFAGNANISDVKSNSHVIYDSNLINTILQYKNVRILDDDLDKLIKLIERNNIREAVDNKTHVHNIQTAKEEYNRKIASGICPRCGGSLVQSNGKYGSFYGCSNYPYCKYTSKQVTSIQ